MCRPRFFDSVSSSLSNSVSVLHYSASRKVCDPQPLLLYYIEHKVERHFTIRPVYCLVSRPLPLLVYRPDHLLVPRSSHWAVSFLMSTAVPVIACQCIGNTTCIRLGKRVSLRIDPCLTFKFFHYVNNCVRLHSCNSNIFCFDWCLGFHTS